MRITKQVTVQTTADGLLDLDCPKCGVPISQHEIEDDSSGYCYREPSFVRYHIEIQKIPESPLKKHPFVKLMDEVLKTTLYPTEREMKVYDCNTSALEIYETVFGRLI